MSSAVWYGYLENTIFSRVKKGLGSTYGGTINFTSLSKSPTTSELPTCYIHELAGLERGMTLDNQNVNAVLCNIQIDIYAASKADCNKITRLAVQQMKNLKFNVVAMPLVDDSNTDVIHSIARFRRLIGVGDKDIVVV